MKIYVHLYSMNRFSKLYGDVYIVEEPTRPIQIPSLVRAGPGVWVAQTRHNFSCPLTIKG